MKQTIIVRSILITGVLIYLVGVTYPLWREVSPQEELEAHLTKVGMITSTDHF